MEKNNNKPKLRFPGFTDSWEQRKLKQLANFAKGQGYSKNDLIDGGTLIILYGRLYTKYQSTISEVDTFAVPKSDSVYSTGEEVIVPASGETAEDIARASAVVKSGFLLGGDLNIIYPNKDINTVFLALLISNGKQQKELSKKAQGKSVVHLHNSDLENISISFPCRDEQEKIGRVFEYLDTLITLHQRKLNHLQDKKKSLLQKMFLKNGEDFPELRFPGFTDPWEQRKLGEIAERVTRKNTKLESTLPLTISAQYGLVDQISFFNKRVASRDVSGYYLLRKGEFAYNKSYSEGYPWGAVKRLERYQKGVLSTLYICFKLANVNSNFLVSYYETNNWYKEVAKRASEGARNHGLLNIAAADFLDTELSIPRLKEEQAIIGSFFQNMDNLITLHQCKLKHLQQQKKALLQQMFI